MAGDWQEMLGKNFGIKIETPKKNSSKNKNFGDKKFNSTSQEKTTAPYNFVSLPKKILPSPLENVELFKEQIKSNKNFSGEIALDIETLTPLFIGGNFADKSKTFSTVEENFPIIPGSSLRGMFKNIFKIVTCGAFRGKTSSQKKGEDFNDEHIYFRCLMTTTNSPAWMNDLNKLYNGRMTSLREGKPVKNARPGFLIQTTDGKYFIAPSKYRTDRKEDRTPIKNYLRNFLSKESCVTWDANKAYIFTGSGGKKNFVRYTLLDYVNWSKNSWLELPDEVRESYEHDRNRRGVNLFKDKGILKREKLLPLVKNLPADIKTLIPCHFLEEGGQVTAFGHGQCFRIPYQNSIGEAVSKNLQTETVDFADAVFGREKLWSSRVFFEDAKLVSEIKTQQTAAAHPLMQPNPTSYQLYLQQNADKLKHWDATGAQLRGYKLYWHNGFADWKATVAELELDKGKTADKRLTKDLTPLSKGNKFISKIRFENLSKIELGALLTVFDLNGAKNPAYKIGQAKPLGFGSIKIKPKLFIESETAYTEIFDSEGWKNPYREENFSDYLDAFKKYIKDCGMEKIWLGVMKELNAMLDFENTKQKNWSDKIKSMSGDVSKSEKSDGVDIRFKNRVPLPTIFEVLK